MKKTQIINKIKNFLKEYENCKLDYQVAKKLFDALDDENVLEYEGKKPQIEISPQALMALAKHQVGKYKAGETESMDLAPALKEVSKVIRDHFKKDSWDLDVGVYATEVAQRFIGIDPAYLLAVEVSTVADLHLAKKGFVFRKKPKKAKK